MRKRRQLDNELYWNLRVRLIQGLLHQINWKLWNKFGEQTEQVKNHIISSIENTKN